MCSVTASHAQRLGFDSRHQHNRREWRLSPVTLLRQGYGMELVTQVSITWLSLNWLIAALLLEAEWSWVWEIPLVLTT